jgi:hypothetical protein
VRDGHEVDLHERVHVGHVLLFEQAGGELPGVVDQHVDIGELVAQRVGRGVDRLARGQVDVHGANLGRAAGRRDDGLERLEVADAGQHELQRAPGELLDHCAADAAAGAGDECGPGGEVHGKVIRARRRARP